MQGHYKGSVCAGHGTVLAGTHAHIQTCTLTGKYRGSLWPASPGRVHALQSYIVSLSASPLYLPSFMFVSLNPSQIIPFLFLVPSAAVSTPICLWTVPRLRSSSLLPGGRCEESDSFVSMPVCAQLVSVKRIGLCGTQTHTHRCGS